MDFYAIAAIFGNFKAILENMLNACRSLPFRTILLNFDHLNDDNSLLTLFFYINVNYSKFDH